MYLKNKNFNQALRNATTGLHYFFNHEKNGKIQLIAAVFTTLTAWLLGINYAEWMWLLICFIMVFITEIFNTAIEHLCNLVDKNYNPSIKIIKDVSAAAALLSSLFSVIIGILILLPKILLLCKL